MKQSGKSLQVALFDLAAAHALLDGSLIGGEHEGPITAGFIV